MWHEAIEQRKPEAQYQVGQCFLDGTDLNQSDFDAARWFRKAAEQGYAPALHRLGDCYRDGIGVVKDANEAENWYRKAQEKPEALHQLGVTTE